VGGGGDQNTNLLKLYGTSSIERNVFNNLGATAVYSL
jgi:hypothetical protein